MTPTKRQRKWAPKVRTGCKTCKIRKKKCDETKPHCLRCIKDKFSCDGYNAPRPWIFNGSQEDNSESFSFLPEKTFESSSRSSSDDQNSLGGRASSPTRRSSEPLAVHHAHPQHEAEFFWEPSTPWSLQVDHNFWRYFLWQFAPLVSTTRQWHYFWHCLVPQTAWLYPAVNHAMVAVAATYESRKSGIDRSALVLQRSNLAIRTFASQPATSDIALVVCRLFTSMAQCKEDFQTAAMHMNSGQRILRETFQQGPARSEIVKIMAPTLLALSTEVMDDVETIQSMPPDKRHVFVVLKTIRSEYAELLRSHPSRHWTRLDTSTNGFLSIAWSTLTQAFSSALYPSLVAFTDDPVLPAAQIVAILQEAGELMSLDDLQASFSTVQNDLRLFFDMLIDGAAAFPDIKHRLKVCVENYVVHAAIAEPRMSAGTFWHEYDDMHCSIDRHLKDPHLNRDRSLQLEFRDHHIDSASRPSMSRVGTGSIDLECKRRDYYIEHVCHYRSGFMPGMVQDHL